MKVEVPSYIIKYIHCQQQGHTDEKVNLICLNAQCRQNCLICSLCTTKHRGHAYKPIKIYLDELYRKYKGAQNNYGQDIEQLEKRKLILLHNLRVCVQKISEQFMRLEEDILFTYDKIKGQIQQNEARRSRFEDFYSTMIKDNYGDPHFEVKQYLFKDEISLLTDQDIFLPIVESLETEIKRVRSNFVTNDRPSKPQLPSSLEPVHKKTAYILPNNITLQGENFTQTNATVNAPNLCLFDLDVGQWIAKLRIHITSFPMGCKLTVGLIRKEQFQKANYLFNEGLNCMYIDSAGKSKGVQHNHIGAMIVNNVLDCFMKKNNFRILCKNNNAIINLPIDKNYYLFFAMDGGCKLKLTYPNNK